MENKIGCMDSHCGDCKLIDWCGDPFENPYLCAEERFKNVNVDDYIKLAETIVVSLDDCNSFAKELNIDDFECVSDYKDAIDCIETNSFKALVADDVAKRIEDKLLSCDDYEKAIRELAETLDI